jgi:hypothetical protein
MAAWLLYQIKQCLNLQKIRKVGIIAVMEDSSFQSPINQFNYSSPEMPKKPKKFVYLVIFLVILVGFYLTKNIFFKSGKQAEKPSPTPAPTEYQFPTDTPAPSINPSEKVKETTPTPTGKAVNPVDSSTGLDRSTLSVEIQNGSGESGVAKKGADILKGFGYKISSSGNADNYDYQEVTIKVKSTKSNFLALLKKDLGFSYTVGSSSADLSSSSTADALVIIGK